MPKSRIVANTRESATRPPAGDNTHRESPVTPPKKSEREGILPKLALLGIATLEISGNLLTSATFGVKIAPWEL